ncbi:MAG: hypothetical protein HQL40_05285 [Alphaproteobacteria bacterium]|nr:hypothetical protein [Alphaproteobacteria bacterium]
MTSKTSHKIGSLGEFMTWTKAVVQDPMAAEGVPRQWFESEAAATRARTREEAVDVSAEAMVKLLSEENVALIGTIATMKPQSMRDLAVLVGRKESNLNRTLKKFQRAGLVAFVAGHGRTRAPVVTATKVRLEIDLTGADRSAVAVEQKAKA